MNWGFSTNNSELNPEVLYNYLVPSFSMICTKLSGPITGWDPFLMRLARKIRNWYHSFRSTMGFLLLYTQLRPLYGVKWLFSKGRGTR